MEPESKQTIVRFRDDVLHRINTVISHYPEGKQKSALVPVLHIAQEQNRGWLNTAVMDTVAEILNISPVEVYEVATFYSQFNLKPVGRYVLEVCRTGPCCLLGADQLTNHLEERLGIGIGETTPDGNFTLKAVECLGACGYGPVIQIGDRYYEHLDAQKADELIEQLSKKKDGAENTDRTY